MIASPPIQVRAPKVLPVATKMERPSVAIPPDAQAPPPRPSVAQAVAFFGSATGMAIIAAVAPMAAVGDVEKAGVEEQGTALVLHRRVERETAVFQAGNIHWPSCSSGTVVERQCKDEVSLGPSVIGRRHSRNVNGAAAWIDDRSASDAERVDIAAGELRSRHRISERLCPKRCAGGGVQRHH